MCRDPFSFHRFFHGVPILIDSLLTMVFLSTYSFLVEYHVANWDHSDY